MVEDTALSFDALNGLPGVYMYAFPYHLPSCRFRPTQLTSLSKHFMESLGHEALNKMLDGFSDRGAKAICTFSYSAGPGSEPIIFQGITQGKIVMPRGPATFGWDAIFEPIEGPEGQT